MMLNKPKYWDRKIGIISIILLPLSLIFIFLSFLKKKLTKVNHFSIPVVCIGNIYIGGTGKTPLAILLAKELAISGKKPVIIRKYYNNHDDEYNLIKECFNNLIICKNRVKGIKEAEKAKNDIAILDDGFQDYSVKKDLNIICFNQNQQIGNGLVLPSGPLRENLNALGNANIVIINGKKDQNFENKLLKINNKIKIFYSVYKTENLDAFKNKHLLAIAGIGNPENFFQLIVENNLNIKKRLIFPDHYNFSKEEIISIVNEAKKNDLHIIMTEKDYFKIKKFKINEVKYLKVKLIIENEKEFINEISKVIC